MWELARAWLVSKATPYRVHTKGVMRQEASKKGSFSGPQKGPAERGHVRKVKKCQKYFSTLFAQGKNRQKFQKYFFEHFGAAPILKIPAPFGGLWFLEGSRECFVEGSEKGSQQGLAVELAGEEAVRGVLRRGSQKGGFRIRARSPFACAFWHGTSAAECTKIARFSAAAAAISTAPQNIVRFFESETGQVSLIFDVPNFCAFSLLVLCLFKLQVEAKKAQKLGTPKIRDTWPFPIEAPRCAIDFLCQEHR